jgi:hypothetical protein
MFISRREGLGLADEAALRIVRSRLNRAERRREALYRVFQQMGYGGSRSLYHK